jgi:hypothetical protein
MGREISLFSDYHAQENSLTNHCGILFRLIYRESPQQFEELVVDLLPEEGQLRVGPLFTQQVKKLKSVPDLLIQQDAFSLFFETKIDDWFHGGQLKNHLKSLANSPGVKVLFCLSNFETDDPETQFADFIQKAKQQGVLVQFVSFEELLQKVRERRLSNSLIETVDEFEEYLDRNGLLPRWRYLLDVVNCGKSMDEVNAGAYVCPNTGGPFSHVRARFLGSYQSKMVPCVYEIDALVACSPGGKEFEVRWKNKPETDKVILARAEAMIKKINVEMHTSTFKNEGLQVFLLGEPAETQFVKDSPRGLQGSHLYFWDIAKKLEAETASALAVKLKGRRWSEFGH